jgi:type I restriction enzyme S subunit
LLPAGTVLFTSRAPIGYVAIARIPVATNQGFKSFVLKDGVLPEYVYWWLKGSKQRAEALASGTTFLELSGANAKKLPIPIAPIDEQRRIVAELEKQLSRLDEAVANLKRVKASISRYRAAALSDAAGSDGRWPSCRIADLLSERIVNGLSVKESPAPTSVRALRLSAMSEFGLHYADYRFLPVDPASVGDILVEEGDFFVSRGNGSLALVGRGTTAQAPPFPVIFPDTMMRLRFTDAEVARWVATLWPSRHVRRQIEQRVKTTAGIYKIAQPQVASISVPLPPAPERERIVAEVDRRFSIAREVEAEIEVNLRREQGLRHALLSRAFRSV